MLPTRARVQAHRLSFVLALHERVPRAMDHRSSGCLPAEKFPTCASGRQGRGPATLLSFPSRFHLTRLSDAAGATTCRSFLTPPGIGEIPALSPSRLL